MKENNMKNSILKIILKKPDERTTEENMIFMKFFSDSKLTGQELKYALLINNKFNE